MGIQDIIEEQNPTAAAGSQPSQQPQRSGQPTAPGSLPTITRVEFVTGMSRDEMVFWMNVVQAAVLVYIALKL